jgi:hypothetical protein
MFKLMLASLLVITAATSASSCEYVSNYTKADGTHVRGYTRNCGVSTTPIDWSKVREIQAKYPTPNYVPEQFDYESYVKNNSSIQFVPPVGYGQCEFVRGYLKYGVYVSGYFKNCTR